MFWYQCRYCKVNFDQWEKLVTHRRDEHKQEFEALKRRSAFLLRRQEEAANRKNKLISKEKNRGTNVNSTRVKSLPLYITTNRMKPTSTVNTPSTINTALSSPSATSTTSRRTHHQHQSSSKELDAKDLENQEISLCIPSSSTSLSLRYSSPLFSRDSPPPYLFPTPTTSPSQNGSSASATSCSSTSGLERFFRSGHPPPLPSSTITSSSFVTPPVTPPRLLPPSPLLSVEELVLNMNMSSSPPASVKKVVQYNDLNVDDEIEFSTTPSSGSQITVTKHPRGNSPETGPVYINGVNREYLAESRIQRRVTKHIMVENLEHELRMTCSSSNINGGEGVVVGHVHARSTDVVSSGGEDGVVETSREPDRVGGRLRSELTERRLKRLHSQLQHGQQSNAGMSPISTSTPSTSSNLGAGVRKRMRIHSTSTNQTSSFNGNQNGGGGGGESKRPSSSCSSSATTTATVNTSSKSSPRVSTRVDKRASSRRPNK